MKVANIIEEGKVGGPQTRMWQIAKYLKKDIETVLIIPKDNSNEFIELCKKNNLFFKVLPITRITKNWKIIMRYIIQFPFELFLMYIFPAFSITSSPLT